ncbi:MAG: D-glycerate dehydrogenase [Calditrichia bacterium]
MSEKKHKIFITRAIPRAGIDILKDVCRIDVYPENQGIPRRQLKEKVADAEGLLCLLTDSIDREIIDNASRLKVISNFAVGYNNIDVDYAAQKGIWVTNTPGVLTDDTADFCWTLIMAVTRRLVEGDRMVRSGGFKGWAPMFMLGQNLREKTLGIVGAGRIGAAVAERSRGWNMRILYFDRNRNEYLENELGAEKADLERLLGESDLVSLHVPLTDDTRHIIDRKALQRMKSSAYLINTARGPLVDEAALVTALRESWIAGAGLDVFENEPEVAPGLSELENVILAPHLGSATVETRNEMARLAARNLLVALEGKKPPFPVNSVAQ